jgi:guanyl-specific ribonuclease Sa
MLRWRLALLAVCGLAFAGGGLGCLGNSPPGGPAAAKDEGKLPPGVPAKVAEVLRHTDETGEPLPGYEGGRSFGNHEHLLPDRDAEGRPTRYHEWDVNPHERGVNRGPERLVTGSDGSAYYTPDHYRTFIKIRE